MTRLVGTVARGIRTPIIRIGDDIAEIVVDSVINASKVENFDLRDRDVIAVGISGGQGSRQLCQY